MPYIILVSFLVIGMLLTSIIQLVRKGRGKTLMINIGAFVCYSLFFFYQMEQAHGWDGLGWLLGGLAVTGVQLLVLFIYSLAVLPKESPGSTPPTQDLHRSAPFSDPNPAPQAQIQNVPVRINHTAPVPQIPQQDPFANSFDDFFDNKESGELPFE